MDPTPPVGTPLKKKYVRAVGPRLRVLLLGIFGLVAALGANSAYLSSITFLEWLQGRVFQNYFYQFMFLAHLVLGLLLIVPLIVFGTVHLKNSYQRPNRRAVRVGYALFIASLVVLFTGVALMRFDFFSIKDPRLRSPLYWAHVVVPVAAVWLYILHRLAGPRIKWQVGLKYAVGVGVLTVGMVAFHSMQPPKSKARSQEGAQYFHPSAARTASGNFIPPETLMNNEYCLKCHADAYQGWFHSAHRFSSFNNVPYLFSVKETREVSLRRDGNVRASRWCAGCHDVVPLFSGAFDDPNFDVEKHPTAKAGITCTACHAITSIGSTRGNGDYVIDEPVHYPFAFSSDATLQFINNQLIKAKPAFHKQMFLKPLHRSAEFCSTCHKVGLPGEVTKYKDFLRGQNHYDPFLLSGVSGHNAKAFYYPEKAKQNCADCHMPLRPSADFGAQRFNPTNDALHIHDHFFPGANTGVAHLRNEPEVVQRQQAFLKDCLRVDIFGVKDGGAVDSPLLAPLRPQVPVLKRGRTYLVEVVLRTLKLGHLFTQGTADSNEVWVDAKVSGTDGRVLGRSGGLGSHRETDPWSHFVNVFMLDRHGRRVDRRNAQDIFVPLYNHQIPPGAAQVVHYSFTVPEDQTGSLTVEMKLNYRKFDTIYLNYVYGKGYSNGAPFQLTNDLPITVIASDHITFPVESDASSSTLNPQLSTVPPWQRWNDYGIGLFLESTDKGSEKGELIQAAAAFEQVEKLGRYDGALNLARVYEREGRLDDAVLALQRAATNQPPAPRWTLAWFNARVNKQNGYLDKAITEFRSILEDRYPELEQRGFDFSKDYEVINELGQTLFERAKLERGDEAKRREFLQQAIQRFEDTLKLDSENVSAHHNLALLYDQLGNKQLAEEHRKLHERYRLDDNARDFAVSEARRHNAAADNAAQATVIYPLQRRGAFGFAQAEPPQGERKVAVAQP